MKFTPKSDSDFEAEDKVRKEKYLWPAKSIVDYEILAATDKISRNGNEMIELDVRAFNANGDAQTIMDWIGDWSLFKLKHICEANNMLKEYNSGDVASYDLYNKTGKCVLGIQKGAKKEDGSFYPDKNTITDYCKPDAQSVSDKKIEDELNDEIGF